MSGPAFSDQNKSWLKRKQQQDDGDESDDLHDHEGEHMLSCSSCVQIQKLKPVSVMRYFPFLLLIANALHLHGLQVTDKNPWDFFQLQR